LPLGRLVEWLSSPRRKFVVDHMNGDPLDNRASNLRFCSASDNCANRKLPPPAFQYHGVFPRNGAYRLVLHCKGRRVTIDGIPSDRLAWKIRRAMIYLLRGEGFPACPDEPSDEGESEGEGEARSASSSRVSAEEIKGRELPKGDAPPESAPPGGVRDPHIIGTRKPDSGHRKKQEPGRPEGATRCRGGGPNRQTENAAASRGVLNVFTGKFPKPRRWTEDPDAQPSLPGIGGVMHNGT
jgi:hypothetical protein